MTAPRDNIRRVIRKQVEALCKSIYRTGAGADLRAKEDDIIQQCLTVAECKYVSRMVRQAPVKETRGPDAVAEVDCYARLAIEYREQHGGTREAAVARVVPDGVKSAQFGSVLTRMDNIIRARKRAKKRPLLKAKTRSGRLAENLSEKVPAPAFHQHHARP